MMSDRGPRGKHWCFTLNNPTLSHLSHLTQSLEDHAKRYVFQLEFAPTTGTPHFQGYVEWKGRQYFNTTKRWVGGVSPHVELCASPSRSINYCRKHVDKPERIDDVSAALWDRGPRWMVGIAKPVESRVTDENLRDWQRELVSTLRFPADDRKIQWWWDATGNVGKTSLARYLVLSDKYNAIYVGGKAGDVKYAISALEPHQRDDLIVIYGVTRSYEKFISYQALEEVKDGIFFSSKYESKQLVMNPPIMIVFANFSPDRMQLSADRWDVHEIVSL